MLADALSVKAASRGSASGATGGTSKSKSVTDSPDVETAAAAAAAAAVVAETLIQTPRLPVACTRKNLRLRICATVAVAPMLCTAVSR